MRIVVRDPSGFDHCLEHDGERWWGGENLAHDTATEAREGLIEQVLRAAATGAALPSGYRKVVSIRGQPFPALPGAEPALIALEV